MVMHDNVCIYNWYIEYTYIVYTVVYIVYTSCVYHNLVNSLNCMPDMGEFYVYELYLNKVTRHRLTATATPPSLINASAVSSSQSSSQKEVVGAGTGK